jgi:hypothetical protein
MRWSPGHTQSEKEDGEMKKLLLVFLVISTLGCGGGEAGDPCTEGGPCSEVGIDRPHHAISARAGDVGAGELDVLACCDVAGALELPDVGASADLLPDPDLGSELDLASDVSADPMDATVYDLTSARDTSVPDARQTSCREEIPDGQVLVSTTFLDGRARGFFAGVPLPVWGEKDVVTVPKCLPGNYVTGADRDCSRTLTWGLGPALCLSGSVPAVPSSESTSSWGLGIEIPVGCSGVLGRDFKTVAIVASGIPAEAVRDGHFLIGLMVRGASSSSLYYTTDDGTGKEHDFGEFNTKWWAPGQGEQMTSAQSRNVSALYVLVVWSSTASYTVKDLCASQVVLQ